ncbi:MAG: DUF3119 domain-containing protein [Cyanobacteria bacterium QH_8_48_120]|nr:MAG: DUF3119 domain-containing protein [Cyanobacteria bacterium QH_1_48_107]PSO58562.1 MAG: DUF3119 domain-containing protein [Cyanobacteria bacterium QH_10_48_56]PSO60895.1 MAG: DUF3119 domain-containing protein [Cyanobacteria bacterium QH_7_48_89]PSO64885.1 MAG: DUF3119 domain-containing protein [Cyanobacteria bacterium QH_6_48_35]PSO64911.1 MAG: DUF3119 domain-containing protein [Cyanobacteria bacterium QH_2_48_84]PSO70762.1 MAG: DUF3119 domain-containing protein [Cyanobacteria bacterium
MTTADSSAGTGQTIELTPSYTLPLVLILASIPVLLLQRWIGGATAILGFFLLFQTATIRLQFSNTALEVYRSEKLLRRFPYSDWQNWRIFWNSVPILFYFKEVNSIHFLPILFDPEMLKTCLEKLCPVE